MSCGVLCVVDISFTVFILITIPFYLILLVALLKAKAYKESSFYIIFISVGCADIIFTLHKYITNGLMRNFFASYVHEWVWLATYRRMGNWGYYYAQVFGVLLMTLNRLTCIFRPVTHKAIWSKQIRSAVVLQWLVSLIIVLPMLSPGGRSYFANNQTLQLGFFNPKMGLYYWRFVVFLEPCILAPIFIISYGAMVVKTATLNSGDRNDRIVEMKMAAIGIILSFLYVCMCCTYIAVLIGFGSGFIPMYGFYYLSDLFTASNPYLLLIFSSFAKESLVGLFRSPNAVVQIR